MILNCYQFNSQVILSVWESEVVCNGSFVDYHTLYSLNSMQSEVKKNSTEPTLVSANQQGTIIVTVVNVTQTKTITQDIYVQIRTDSHHGDKVNYQHNPGKKTRLVSLEKATWNEHFYYNTQELFDDNLTFVLRERDGTEMGRCQKREVRLIKRKEAAGSIEELLLDLRNEYQEHIGTLKVWLQFQQNRDVIGGICMPDLSLAPKYPYEPKYNAIDGYNPNVKTNKANCFSFYDGDMVPGFDNIDVYPPKFKHPQELTRSKRPEDQ